MAEVQEAQALREAKAQAAVMDGRRPRDWVSGGRSTYTTAKAAAVCREMRAGAPLSEVVAQPGMPSAKAIYRWLKRFPAFAEAYAEACEVREDMVEAAIEEIVDTTNLFNFPANKARVAALEGRAGRMRPRR